MINYLKEINYFDIFQSAYMQLHSTITATLNMLDYIYMNILMVRNLFFLFCLIILKDFDCANHQLILAKLMTAGFCVDSLECIFSYDTKCYK